MLDSVCSAIARSIQTSRRPGTLVFPARGAYPAALTEILSDIVAEARRLLDRAAESNVGVRLLGGVAVRLHARDGLPAALDRTYGDLDFVAPSRDRKVVARFFADSGYTPHTSFNALNAKERLLFFDDPHDRQVDVFIGSFRMCHAIPLEDRLHLDETTIPLAELLLTKLQVVELNEKDVRDAVALVHDHPVAEHDDDAINERRVAELCAEDWGLWRTISANLQACYERVDLYELPADARKEAAERLRRLADRIEAEPKSRAWRMRSRLGDRKRWYELPEERR